jgi:hypothetical protein
MLPFLLVGAGANLYSKVAARQAQAKASTGQSTQAASGVSGLSVAGAGASLLGGALDAYSLLTAGKAQAKALNFQAKQAELDAQITLQNADLQARSLRLQGRQLTGTQRTRNAISGIRLEGTPLQVMLDSMEAVEVDAENIRKQGAFQSAQLNQQAKIYKLQAKDAKKASKLGAAGSLLGGGAGAVMQ